MVAGFKGNLNNRIRDHKNSTKNYKRQQVSSLISKNKEVKKVEELR
jgi:hypothetical protein